MFSRALTAHRRVRALSTKKTSQAASPGVPLPVQPDSTPAFLVKLPRPSTAPPAVPVQVPYAPDFWDSARPKADAPLELELPKVHVVSGPVPDYDAEPTRSLEKEGDPPSPAPKQLGFWPDFWDGLGLPRSFSVRSTLSKARNVAAQAGEHESQTRSRPLTDEERKGLYILLGVIGGSWLVGGLVNRPTTVAEDGTQNQHSSRG